MLVVYLRPSALEDVGFGALCDSLVDCGFDLQGASTVEQLEEQLRDPGCCGLAHVVGVSDVTAPQFVKWAREHPDRMAIVAGPLRGLVKEFLAPLQAEDLSLLVVIYGYERLSAQLRSAMALLVVRRWMLALRDCFWPHRSALDSGMQACIQGLYVERPFIDGARRGRAPAIAKLSPQFNRLLANEGLKTQAKLRAGHFVALLCLCVREFGMEYLDAVALCGAEDVEAADRKLFEVLQVRNRAEAWDLDILEVGRRIMQYCLASVLRELPSLEIPPVLRQWLDAQRVGRSPIKQAVLTEAEQLDADRLIRVCGYDSFLRTEVRKHLHAPEQEGVAQEVWLRIFSDRVNSRLFLPGADPADEEIRHEARQKRLRDFAWSYSGNRSQSVTLRREHEVHPDWESIGESSFGQSSDDVAMNAERSELRSKIEAVLHKLTEAEQELIRLRLLEDLTYKQIGSRLGIATATARTRIKAAEESLRAMGYTKLRPWAE